MISGAVFDGLNGRPIPSADVQLLPSGARAVTDERGRFTFRAAGAGPHRLRVTALGYREALVDVPPSGAFLRVALEQAPIPLREIVIAPGQIGVLEVTPAAMGNALSRADIEAIPQFGDDAFRTLQRIPGVTSEDISTKLHVRGSSERDVLVRLDGVELFEPYHLKDQDGALGIVDVQVLGGIDLITGGFPAEYGDRMAGVFDMTTRQPPATGMRNTVGMSLSSLSYGSQGSFAGGKGQWLASARRGFLDIVLDIAGTDDDLSPRFWDALGRAQYLVTPNHLLSFNLLHAGDDGRWSDPDDTGSSVTSNWSNGYAWLGWRATLGRRVRAETILSTGRLDRDRTGSIPNSDDGVFTPLFASLRDKADFSFHGVRQDWQADLSENVMFKTGFEARSASGTYDYSSAATFLDLDARGRLRHRTDTTRVDMGPSDTWVAGYVSARARAGSSLTFEAGVRYDRHSLTRDEDVAPRFLVRYDVDDRTVVRGSWGHYYQAQGVHELNTADGETAFSPSQRADQAALGVERRLGSGVTGRLEAYRRDVSHPHPAYVNLSREINPLQELESDRARLAPTRSRARGIELTFNKEDASAFSWAGSYILAQSEDEVDGRWAPRTLDQRHTLNLMAAWRSGSAWQISGLWQYHSGWPITAQQFDVVVTQDAGGQRYSIVRREFGPLNAENLPAYQRLDVRVTRGFDLRRGRLEVFLDVFNVLDRLNVRGFTYNLQLLPDGTTLSATRGKGEEMLPILPTLGFRMTF
jgi:outer membrane cobalamin receptor